MATAYAPFRTQGPYMAAHDNYHDTDTPLPEINGFRLLRLISHGGMSSVFLGEQLALSREVAIKVMLPQALADEVSRRRFENEVRTIARLEHPNIVRIHELGRTREGLPYYTMPFLSRGHLGRRRFVDERGVTDEARVREIAHALLAALEYSHSRGVVHRDVKAENVLFDDAERPLLADFGIALRRGFGPRVTAAGLAVGSTAYMAPEQARGEDVDGRADLYSLGVVIWEMLTGGLPFQAADALSMAVMHAQDPIPKLPPALRHWQRFMNRALAKNPDQRFASTAEMRIAMDAVRPSRGFAMLSRFRGARSSDTQPVVPAVTADATNSETHATQAQRVDRRSSGTDAARAPAAPADAPTPRRRFRPAIAALVAAAAVAGAIALLGDDGRNDMFRAGTTSAPVVDAPADPTDAMLQPLPEAPLQGKLQLAREQLRQRKLTAPENGNAYSTTLEAWHIDSTDPQVTSLVGDVMNALSEELVRNVGEGNDTRALDYHRRASELARQTGNANSEAMQRLTARATQTLQARMENAVERYDRKAAERTAKLAAGLGLPGDVTARFAAQAKDIPQKGQPLPGDRLRGVLRDGERGPMAVARRPVTVADYRRFAEATRREPSLCRERASLLRVLAPKSWKSPGFSQSDGEAVVCVSMADAESFARWYGQQMGHRYRLPTAEESRQTSPEISGRDVSLWLRDCGNNCVQRLVGGNSWRSREAQRPLAANRGYDDVGFRLVRDL